MKLNPDAIQDYLSRWIGAPARLEKICELGGTSHGAEALKAFGYGRPLCLDFTTNGEVRRLILRQIKRNGFGHERAADRVGEIWEDFKVFSKLPRHIASKDILKLNTSGHLDSIADAQEFLLLTEYVPGDIYANDLLRMRETGACSEQDGHRARTLAQYLVEIHSKKLDDPLLWRRRLRDLVGHGEGIFGLTDSYPPSFPLANSDDLRAIEEQANRWRWKLKPLTHRLSQVHGDFHPYNILFEEAQHFHVLDRSRGEWGEPADDVSSITINYLFSSVQKYGELAGPFETLFNIFFETYLNGSNDDGLLTSIQPWFAWRVLVVASPVWYPNIANDVRMKLFHFARNVMSEDRFEWKSTNRYLKA